MKQLILFARPGIVVVSGSVKYLEREKVVIENNLYLPVSKKYELRRMEISFPEQKIRNMKLKIGSFIMATVKNSDLALDEVIHAGEVLSRTFYVEGYNLRYSGSFDFDAYGEQKETHVLSGKVEDVIRKQNGDVTFTLSDWKRGQVIEHHIYLPAKKASEISTGKKVAVVTGECLSNGFYAGRRAVDLK